MQSSAFSDYLANYSQKLQVCLVSNRNWFNLVVAPFFFETRPRISWPRPVSFPDFSTIERIAHSYIHAGKKTRLRLRFNKVGYQLYAKEQSRRVASLPRSLPPLLISKTHTTDILIPKNFDV